LYCASGEYVRQCSARVDAACIACTTLSASDVSMVYALGNLDLDMRTGTEQQQCLAGCADGYFEWLRAESSGIGMLHRPLCFACTDTICGSDSLVDIAFGSVRSLIGLQYTSKCTDTHDSKCHTCAADVVGLDTTELVKNGNQIGSFCAYRCLPGHYICEECRFLAPADVGGNSSRHTMELQADETTTGAWRRVPGDVALWYEHTAGTDSATNDKTYRFTGSVLFSTWPYGTEFKICLSIRDTTTAFVMTPIVVGDDVCTVVVKPQVSGVHTMKNVSFSVDVEIFRMFPDITAHVDANNNAQYNHLQLHWEVSTVPSHAVVTLWHMEVARYIISDTCCGVPHSCIACDEHSKVDNAHFLQSTYDSSVQDVAVSAQCAWECDEHYEDYLHNGTCLFCETPDCATGEFFEDCGLCGHCVGLPADAAWVPGVTIRGDNLSCAFSCDTSFYRNYNTDGLVSCLNCSTPTCTNGTEYLVECNPYEDARCIPCSACTAGTYESTSCEVEHNRECHQCEATVPYGAFWTNVCEYQCLSPLVDNTVTRSCFLCDPQCPVGEYSLLTCDISSNFTGCQSCVIPPGAFATSPGMLYNNTCRWQCPPTYYYDGNSSSCVLFLPVVEPPVVVCNHTQCSMTWGHSMDTVSCTCVACAQPRGNASQVDVSTWEATGTCSWFCMNPYMRQGNHCYRIRDLTAMQQVAAAAAATSDASATRSSWSFRYVSASFSVVAPPATASPATASPATASPATASPATASPATAIVGRTSKLFNSTSGSSVATAVVAVSVSCVPLFLMLLVVSIKVML
jgi:hypothetical protein